MKNLDSSIPFSGKSILPLLSTLIILTLNSCFSSRPISYFSQGQVDSLRPEQINIPDQVIQKGDILSITIYSDNPEATAIFNQASGGAINTPPVVGGTSMTGASASASQSVGAGYLVDNNGNIRIHALGLVHVDGLTKGQLSEEIIGKLSKLNVLSNPYCVIRFLNFKVSVLGEVRSPGVFTLNGETTSILEALSMAGDITDYGLKDRVILIRQEKGQRTFYRMNMLDPSITQSPNYYVRQNDVIMVEADRKKPTARDMQTLSYITVGATVVSSIAILLTLFK
ncbi:MAG: polysaccharide biosynthesis/export family protein [Chitinophagaceae bacterium]